MPQRAHRKQTGSILLLSIVVLLLAALLGWQLWQETANPLAVNAKKVDCIKLERDGWSRDDMVEGIWLTERAEIQAFCETWNDQQIVEVEPYLSVVDTWTVSYPTGEQRDLAVEFYMDNGDVRRYEPIQDYIFSYSSTDVKWADRFYFYKGEVLINRIESLLAEATP